MAVKGSVVGSTDGTDLTSIQFNLGLAISGTSVDLTQCTFSYWDASNLTEPLSLDSDDSGQGIITAPALAGEWTYQMSDLTNTSAILSGSDVAVIIVTMPTDSAVTSYETFTVHINPPTGASITIQRTLGAVSTVMSLN